jgi:outer membrane receptor protein involved in Fe transport
LNGSYRFRLGSVNATLVGNINNVFNQEYISDAIDGASHDDRTAYGIFYGFGRTYSV